MEIVIKAKKKKNCTIARRANGDGVVKIDGEACDDLERVQRELSVDISIRELASLLIKEACNHAIIKVEEEEE